MAEPLIHRLTAYLGSLRAALSPIARETSILPRDGPVRPRPEPAADLPALRWLPQAQLHAPAATADVAAATADLAGALEWRQTYGRAEASEAFLANYAWTELAGAQGLVADPKISAGLLLLGPHTLYPAHRHLAIEHYVPLSGAALWWDEDREWRLVEPLSLILHRSGVRHAMRTGAEPLLAYFHWSGPGVGERSRLSTRQDG
jgi:hypothetical protein